MKHKKIALFTIMLLAIVLMGSLVACRGENQRPDNEKTPLLISTQELDGVFSPFYSTSAYDGQVVGMTQIGMLDFDKEGRLDYGDEAVTVARYVNETAVDTRSANQKNDEKGRYEQEYHTTYQIVLKNGIKFSDGVDLTYKDVLFNLYMYLDPVYNGSSTLYSTDILGLLAYRTQDTTSQDASGFDADIQVQARERVKDFVAYYKDGKPNVSTERSVLESDLEYLKKAFKDEELNSDWSMFASGLENYKKEYVSIKGKELVTEVWQAFLVNWRVATITYDDNGPDPTKYVSIDYGNHATAIAEIKNTYKKDSAAKIEERIKEYCIGIVYTMFFATDEVFKIKCQEFIGGTSTGNNYFSYVSNQIKTELLAGDKLVENISGIKLVSLKEGDKFRDTKKFNKEITLDEDHYAIEITIYGVDPKAISNFGFTVAPMHYYSDPDTIAKKDTSIKFTTEKDGWKAFSIGDPSKEDHFGFAFANSTYMDKVVKAVIGLPVGAGIYKASNRSDNPDNVTALGTNTGFYDSNIVYYERNTYFETVAKSDDIHNATIKKIRLVVINATRLFDAVKSNTVHYADPSAKKEIMNELNNSKTKKDLKYVTTRTNGYGYIGVNAKYVPDLLIRRAIMFAMDTSKVLGYYPNDLAENIYRPMSVVSWAYPKADDGTALYTKPYYDNTGADNKFSETVAKAKVNELRVLAGYTQQGKNCFQKQGDSSKTLEYTFSIAGGNTDHPAYLTMQSAADLLNSCGFKIKVVTDPFALRKLSAGTLAVWAAAWGSGIDPDMFQVYHKDSQATSINSWGYPSILGKGAAEKTGTQEEIDIIENLSDKIDAARKITNETARAAIYKEALNLIMDLAVELPTYQRSNLYVYKSSIIDESSLLSDKECSPYVSPIANLWKVSFVQ